jgi:hypothetical protein
MKVRYGVMVSGAGIAPSVSVCGNTTGVTAGFVEEGQSLSLNIPKGNARTVDVLLNLVPNGTLCPSWTMRFGATASQLRSTFLAGSISGVDLNTDNAVVDVPVAFPGIDKDLMTSNLATPCMTPMHGQLLSNGDVINETDLIDSNLSNEMNESFFTSLIADIFGTGTVSSSSQMNLLGTSPLAIPEYVYSVTRKPDTGSFYGLMGEGQIVALNFNGTEFTVAELTAATCPFALLTCEVPAWAQSISAGVDQELYMLDHGGIIYRMMPDGTPIPTGDSVSSNVVQISYY